MSWMARELGFDSWKGQEIFLFPSVQAGSGAQTAPYPLRSGAKAPGREADHSPPSSAEIKNIWSYTSTRPYALVAWCLMSCVKGQF
jgi:hypothetical protein